MKTRAELIRDATNAARASWDAYSSAQLEQIMVLMQQSANEITAKLANYEKGGILQKNRLAAMQKEISAEITRLRTILNRRLKAGMVQGVNYGLESGVLSMSAAELPGNYKVAIGSSYLSASGKVIRYNAAQGTYTGSTWAKINGRAIDALLRYNPEGLTLSEKVWNITWQTEQSIRRSINLGVLQGKSAASVSREIRMFLAEPSGLFRRVRKDGKLVLSKPARAYHPGRGVYRSSAKNAMRLARTEYQRAFHEGMYRYVQEKDWIEGVIWRRGGSDPCDVCDELANRFFTKDNIPHIPHPQCLPGKMLVCPIGDVTGATVREFDGQVITITTTSGQKVTCTPNHPILSRSGWIAAHEIKKGQDVLCGSMSQSGIPAMDDVQPPSLIENVFRSFNESGGVTSVPVEISAPDFHGDGIQGQIAIVSANRFLGDWINAILFEVGEQFLFQIGHIARSTFDALSQLAFMGPRLGLVSYGIVGGHGARPFAFRRPSVCRDGLRFGQTANMDPSINKAFSNCPTSDGVTLRQHQDGFARLVGRNDVRGRKDDPVEITRTLTQRGGWFSRVCHVSSSSYSGKVYNLETRRSYYLAGGVATHNCLCHTEPVIKGEELPEDALTDAPDPAIVGDLIPMSE